MGFLSLVELVIHLTVFILILVVLGEFAVPDGLYACFGVHTVETGFLFSILDITLSVKVSNLSHFHDLLLNTDE